MCLEKTGKKQLASKDIVVYKKIALYDNRVLLNAEELDGMAFTCEINGISTEGVISIEKDESISFIGMYFCTNNMDIDGKKCLNMHGYEYSWILDGSVDNNSIVVEGKELIWEGIKYYHTPYRNFRIELGKTYTSELVECKKYGCNVIETGLHSYKEKKAAGSRSHYSNEYMVKCIIPRGSYYYVGEFNSHVSYASDTLMYTEDIKKIK